MRLAMKGAFETGAAREAEQAAQTGWGRPLPWFAGVVLALIAGSAIWILRPALPATQVAQVLIGIEPAERLG